MGICSKDCFHCPYPDCICDEMDAEDYTEARQREKELMFPETEREKKHAAYQRAYYEANKAEIAAYQRAYREANKAELAAKKRAYREANKAEIAAKRRAL